MTVSLVDRIEALEYLVLAHIRAVSRTDAQSAKTTCEIAGHFAQLFQNDGRPGVTRQLTELADSIRVHCEIGMNDG